MTIQDVIDDLVTTNDIGDGSREYEEHAEGVLVTTYDDPDDGVKVTGRFIVRFTIETSDI